jgi:hypothetical protein
LTTSARNDRVGAKKQYQAQDHVPNHRDRVGTGWHCRGQGDIEQLGEQMKQIESGEDKKSNSARTDQYAEQVAPLHCLLLDIE